MRRFTERVRNRLTEDRGAVLLWVAGSLVAFLGFSAFAVDLGFLYLRTTQLQNAADSAATAGVVYIPGSQTQANQAAHDAAAANGFAQDPGTIINVLDDNALQVTLETEVPTFLLRALGRDSFDVVRQATAEYIKPVRLGSPENTFGSPGQEFWAAINGKYTDRQQGDPFSSRCIEADEDVDLAVSELDDPDLRCDSLNPTSPGDRPGDQSYFRPGGYYYGIEVPVGATTLDVDIYDGDHWLRTNGGTHSSPRPGDTVWRWDGSFPIFDDGEGVHMSVSLYDQDTTPNNPIDNVEGQTPLCGDTFRTRLSNTYTPGWSRICDGQAVSPGIYVLNIPAPLHEGSSKFGIRAFTNVGSPKVYGLLDMSIHVNRGGGNPQPYLAEVEPVHAGKTFEVDIFDIGESNTMTLQILPPSTATFNGTPVSSVPCTWTSTDDFRPGATSDTSTCTFDVGSRRFNDEWLYIDIDLNGYSCNPAGGSPAGTGCWWRVDIRGMSNPTDRTTWAARISGNPIRLSG